jgi:hypothetical protein
LSIGENPAYGKINHMSKTNEATFESAIIQHLVHHGGYTQGGAEGCNPDSGLFAAELLSFLQDS